MLYTLYSAVGQLNLKLKKKKLEVDSGDASYRLGLLKPPSSVSPSSKLTSLSASHRSRGDRPGPPLNSHPLN